MQEERECTQFPNRNSVAESRVNRDINPKSRKVKIYLTDEAYLKINGVAFMEAFFILNMACSMCLSKRSKWLILSRVKRGRVMAR